MEGNELTDREDTLFADTRRESQFQPFAGIAEGRLGDSDLEKKLIGALDHVKESLSFPDSLRALEFFFSQSKSELSAFYSDVALEILGTRIKLESGSGSGEIAEHHNKILVNSVFKSFEAALPSILKHPNTSDYLLSSLEMFKLEAPAFGSQVDNIISKIELYLKDNFDNLVNEIDPDASSQEIEKFREFIGANDASYRAALNLVRKDWALRVLYEEFSESDKLNFSLSLQGYLKERKGNEALLLMILRGGDSSGFDEIVKSLEGGAVSLVDLVRDEAFYPVLNFLIDRQDHFKVQLGKLLASLPLKIFPEGLRVKLKIFAKEEEFKIKPSHPYWFLCSDAEPRLEQALKEHAILLVNDSLVLKFRGKLSALCVQTFNTKEGFIFLEGNWYAPVGDEFREELRSCFSGGQREVHVKSGEWALMRDLSPGKKDLLNKAKLSVKQNRRLSSKVGGLSRTNYLETHKEDD